MLSGVGGGYEGGLGSRGAVDFVIFRVNLCLLNKHTRTTNLSCHCFLGLGLVIIITIIMLITTLTITY